MMSANSWMPPTGRHQVGMGRSMTRFLRQRKGLPALTSQTKPVSSYFHFKYNSIPESVDNAKPGVVEVSQDISTMNVRVERASHNIDEVHMYRSKETHAKEVECVLIYAEETGLFTLEKLDSCLMLFYERRGAAQARVLSDSPTLVPRLEEQEDLTAELDRELLAILDDAEDEGDDEVPLAAGSARAVVVPPPSVDVQRKNEPLHPPPVDMSSGKPRPKLSGVPSKPPTFVPVTPAPAAFVQPSSPKTKNVHRLEIEVEELEFGQPTRITKRARLSPSVSSSTSLLALPTAGGTTALAPPPFIPPAPPSIISPVTLQDDDDDDEEWEEIIGPETNMESDEGEGESDGEVEEIDIDLLTAEVDKELLSDLQDEGDSDEDEEMFGTYEEHPHPGVLPISLNQFAGGSRIGGDTEEDDDDDDYSSTSSDSDSDRHRDSGKKVWWGVAVPRAEDGIMGSISNEDNINDGCFFK